VGEHEAAKLLALYGLPMAKQVLIGGPGDAGAATAALRAPYVVKAAAPQLAHRSDFGGVIAGVADTEGVAQAAETVIARARAAHPGARIDGALVAEMAPAGTELIVGVQADPTFGPVLMVGLGGVWAEALGDTSLRLAPVDPDGARAMLESLRGAPVIFGARGQPALDVDAIVGVMVALGELAVDAGEVLQAVEVNPLIAYPTGAVVVDALIELGPAPL
jgi:succinyl-CoA synthetase beta subunit